MTELPSAPDLAALHQWFSSYCGSFRDPDPEVERNYALKELHTRKVCEAAIAIAQGGGERRSLLAEVASLCHDLGRFPQYRDFRTFKDSISINHAELSARIAEEEGLLDFLPESDRQGVLTAVRYHNVYQIPEGLPPEAEDLLRIVRDADKIDIWRVFIDHFAAPEEERATGATLGFPDLPTLSDEVLATVSAGKMVQLSMVRTVNDFKVLQLSWVYDINLSSSCRLIRDRNLLQRLAATLPEEKRVREVVSRVQGHLEERAREVDAARC